MPRRTAGASRTSATSPSSTGVVAAHRDHRAAQVVDASARGPTARTVHSIGPCATKPPEAFTFDALDARAAPRRA